MNESEPESTFRKREKLNEKTPLLDSHRKMSSSTGYTELLDDSTKADRPTVRECCSCQKILSTLCSCAFWYHVLMFIFLPWAIYHYRIHIVNWFYGCQYGELPRKATEPSLGPKVKRLRNLGNTCFFNSMNQSINQTVLLHEILTNCITQPRKYAMKPEQQEQLVVQVVSNTELINLTNEAHDLYCSQIAIPLWHVAVPSGLLRELSNRNSRFGRCKEEDSHEALRCLLDGLRMEEIDKIKDQVYAHFGVTKVPASQSNLEGEEKLKLKVYLREAAKQCVPVDTVFGGVQVSTTVCRECYTALQNEEKFFDMSLPLPEDQAETVGASGYRPPAISNQAQLKGLSFNGKEPSQGESHKDGVESADDTVHDKEPVDQSEPKKEPLEDSQPDQTCDTVNDRDIKPLINIVESDHDSVSEHKSDKEESLNVEIHQPGGVNDVDDEHNVPKEDGDTGVDEPAESGESATTADPTSKLEGEEHDNQVTNVDDVNSQPDVDVNPETVPAEERRSEEVPLQKKNDQDVIDVNLSSEKPDPDVALNKAKLHEYLESKGLLYQMPAESEKEKDPQTLEAILTEYTTLDILDEDNKFICKTCTENHNGDDDDPPLSLVSKQIAVHRLPPVLILHLKRFSIEPDGIFKDTQHIKFSFKLNMAPYCTTRCIEEMGDRNQEIWYGLYAVVVHDGNTLDHGHYFAYVRRRHPTTSSSEPPGKSWIYDQAAAEGGHWFYASDLTVRLCDRGFEEVRGKKAYMLFYELLPKRL